MKIVAVTTQNKQYYDKLGKESIDSFVKYWPKTVELHVFAEDFKIENHDNVIYHSFDELDQEFHNFQETEYKKRIKIFSMKAFSWLKMCDTFDADRIIWVDSDVITYNYIPVEFLTDLCDNDTLATFMAVIYDHKKTKEGIIKIDPLLCGETGFYVINKNHSEFKNFTNRYREYYVTGEGEKLRRFYDGDVFGSVVTEFQNKGTKFRDLGDKKHNTVFKFTILSEFMTHFKGKVKKAEGFEVPR